MYRYHSNLEAALKQRSRRQKEIQNEFVEIKNHLVSEENELRKTRQKLEKALEELATRQTDGIEVDEIDIYYRFMRLQENKLESQQETVKNLSDQCEAKQSMLAQATKEKKAVEKIDAKRRKTHEREIKKKEQGMIDEIAGRLERETP